MFMSVLEDAGSHAFNQFEPESTIQGSYEGLPTLGRLNLPSRAFPPRSSWTSCPVFPM